MQIKPSSTLPFQGKFTYQDFIKEIKKFDLVSSLMLLQKLGAKMSNQVWVNINIEFEFHTTQKERYLILLRRDFISFLAKQMLLNSQPSDRKHNLVDLVELIYQYNNLETELGHIDPRSKDAWLWILRTTYNQWFYLRLPEVIIGRYQHLFSKVMVDAGLKEKCDSVLGIDLFDLSKIGMCIYANYCPRSDGQYADSFLISSYTNTTIKELRGLLSKDNITHFLNLFSVNQTEFKKENEKFQINNDLLKGYEFNPLRRFPVIKTNSREENQKYIIPSLSDFVYCFSEGLYYVLLDKLDSEEKGRLFEKFGIAFEEYIEDLITYYNIEKLSQAVLYQEQPYLLGKNSVKSADWILVSDKYIFQIECKKRKLNNYSKAGINNEDNRGISEFVGNIAKQLDKMIVKEQHIRDGLLKEIKHRDQEFVNIIIYLDEMFTINEYGRKAIKENMEKEANSFNVFGCYEFEIICQYSKDKGKSLYKSIQDYNNKKINDIYRINFLKDAYGKFYSSLMVKK